MNINQRNLYIIIILLDLKKMPLIMKMMIILYLNFKYKEVYKQNLWEIIKIKINNRDETVNIL